MDKILTFIVNESNELFLLKGSDTDLQLEKWYVVTYGSKDYDLNKEEKIDKF